MVLNEAYKSIYATYRTQKQIVTRVNVAHSGFSFAFAKIRKETGFCKVFARKKVILCSHLTHPHSSFLHHLVRKHLAVLQGDAHRVDASGQPAHVDTLEGVAL